MEDDERVFVASLHEVFVERRQGSESESPGPRVERVAAGAGGSAAEAPSGSAVTGASERPGVSSDARTARKVVANANSVSIRDLPESAWEVILGFTRGGDMWATTLVTFTVTGDNHGCTYAQQEKYICCFPSKHLAQMRAVQLNKGLCALTLDWHPNTLEDIAEDVHKVLGVELEAPPGDESKSEIDAWEEALYRAVLGHFGAADVQDNTHPLSTSSLEKLSVEQVTRVLDLQCSMLCVDEESAKEKFDERIQEGMFVGEQQHFEGAHHVSAVKYHSEIPR